MITRITGVLESMEALEAAVRPEGSGVSHQVLTPGYLADRLREQVGGTVSLHTLEYLEGQGQGSSFVPRLIGFATRDERRFFELLTAHVDGFGNRRALRVLVQEPALVARAIRAGDVAWLQTLPEVGKKTAERMVHELKDKVEPFLTGHELAGMEAKTAAHGGGAGAEAIAALVALGETRIEAERMVLRALASDPGLGSTAQIVAAAYGARPG